MSFTLDWERFLFVIITLVVYAVTASTLPQLFQVTKNNRRFLFFYILTLFTTLGVFFSADLFTTFCFFELMTLTSFAYVANDETDFSRKAALSYLAYGITGGLVMLFGILLLYSRLGTLNYEQLREISWQITDKSDLYLPGACLLFGFGAKAGMYPLHTWLPKTYVAAPCAGTTVLSAVLSKAGIFGIYMICFSLFEGDRNWGLAIAVLGCLTMFTGGLLGLFSVHLKRTLACSSMSQIGFILVAIGTGNSLGAMFHTVNHSLFKLILFTIVSLLFGMTEELDYNKLAGFANHKKWLRFPFLCAALGISGVPLFNGYVSKTAIHESIVESISYVPYTDLYVIIEWVFLISGGMTFAYMLKMYFALFHNQAGEDSTNKNTCNAKPGILPQAALFLLGTLCILSGLYFCFPPVSSLLSWETLKGSLISLTIGVLIYLLFVRPFMTIRVLQENKSGQKPACFTIYRDIYPEWLDIEELIYKPLFIKLLPFIGAFFSRILDRLVDGFSILVMRTVLRPSGRSHVKNDHPLAFIAGKTADGIFYLVHVKIRKKPPVSRASYADLFTVGSTEFSRTTRLILYSVSFGLLLFSMGLMAALIYLLWAI